MFICDHMCISAFWSPLNLHRRTVITMSRMAGQFCGLFTMCVGRIALVRFLVSPTYISISYSVLILVVSGLFTHPLTMKVLHNYFGQINVIQIIFVLLVATSS